MLPRPASGRHCRMEAEQYTPSTGNVCCNSGRGWFGSPWVQGPCHATRGRRGGNKRAANVAGSAGANSYPAKSRPVDQFNVPGISPPPEPDPFGLCTGCVVPDLSLVLPRSALPRPLKENLDPRRHLARSPKRTFNSYFLSLPFLILAGLISGHSLSFRPVHRSRLFFFSSHSVSTAGTTGNARSLTKPGGTLRSLPVTFTPPQSAYQCATARVRAGPHHHLLSDISDPQQLDPFSSLPSLPVANIKAQLLPRLLGFLHHRHPSCVCADTLFCPIPCSPNPARCRHESAHVELPRVVRAERPGRPSTGYRLPRPASA